MSSVVGLAIEGILYATIGVLAINLIANGNFTGVDGTVQTVAKTVVAIVIAIAAVLLFLKRAGYSMKL